MDEHSKKKGAKLAASVVGSAAVIAAGLSTATAIIMKRQFGKGSYPDRRFSFKYRYDPDYIKTHTRENVQFKSGANTLQGYIYGMENKDPKGLLVFAHGIYTGHESYINQLMWFVDRGWRVFAYDATGSCTSEGNYTVGLVQSALDLDKALDYAATDPRLSGLPVCLMGHSWGGYAVSAVLNFDHEVKAVAELSGYAYPKEMLDLGARGLLGKVMGHVFEPFSHGYNDLVFKEYRDLNAVDGINKRNIPVLVIHGELDDFVDYKKVSILSKRGKITNPNVEYVTLTGEFADHNNFFNSEQANLYIKKFNEKLNKIKQDVYDGFIPDDDYAKLFTAADKTITNRVNTQLLELIEKFFLKALSE